jgi:hypothetical protein
MGSMRNWLTGFALALAMGIWFYPVSPLADDGALSIVKLAFRDHFVTISSTADGIRYSVYDRSGALLDENLTDQELLAAHPQLHSRIRSGYASDETGSFIWAGRDELPSEPPGELSVEEE